MIDDAQGVPILDSDGEFGALRLPADWHLVRDQLSVVKPPPEDEKQRKDAAMVVYMLADLLWRRKRAGLAPKVTPFPIYAGRSYSQQQTRGY